MVKHKIVTLFALCLMAGLLVLSGTGPLLAGSLPKATGGVGFTTIEENGDELYRRIEFNAHATDPAKGKLNYRDANGDWFRVDIQCVTVMGDSAYFSGPIVSASQNEWLGQWLLVGVYDGGTPGSKGDLVWGEMYRADPGCQPSDDLGGPWAVENGNLVVH